MAYLSHAPLLPCFLAPGPPWNVQGRMRKTELSRPLAGAPDFSSEPVVASGGALLRLQQQIDTFSVQQQLATSSGGVAALSAAGSKAQARGAQGTLTSRVKAEGFVASSTERGSSTPLSTLAANAAPGGAATRPGVAPAARDARARKPPLPPAKPTAAAGAGAAGAAGAGAAGGRGGGVPKGRQTRSSRKK